MVNPCLLSLRGVNQLYTTGGSQDMENHTTSSSQGLKKPEKLFLGHLRLPERYTYLRTFIVNQDCGQDLWSF